MRAGMWLWFAGPVCVLAALSGCRNLIGIEDHRFTADAGPDAAGGGSCAAYCDAVTKNCDMEPLEAFQNGDRTDCLAWCSHLPEGERADMTTGNSVSCRAHYAAQASRAEGDVLFCPPASPGGGSPGADMACGNNCEAYCGVYEQVCPESSDDACLARCPGLPDKETYSATVDFMAGDDTIQCRIAHLTAASRYKYDAEHTDDAALVESSDGMRLAHCGHSKLRPDLSASNVPCDLKAETAPNCEDYCKLIQVACSASGTKVYDDQAQCLAVCKNGFAAAAGVPKNKPDTSQDTLSCRRWHAYFALTDSPMDHCPHAGPGGAGHCGQVCPTYCQMLERGCKTRYAEQFADDEMCQAACQTLNFSDGMDQYSVSSEAARTDTYQCRLHNLAKIFTNKDGATTGCDHVFPADSCPQ